MQAKRLLMAVALVMLAMSLVAVAARAADSPLPPADNSGIAQYIEQIPSSVGAQAKGVTSGTKTRLPKGIAAELHRYGGQDAALLRKIASSSTLGAPQATASGGGGGSPITPVITTFVVMLVSTVAFGAWRFGLGERFGR